MMNRKFGVKEMELSGERKTSPNNEIFLLLFRSLNGGRKSEIVRERERENNKLKKKKRKLRKEIHINLVRKFVLQKSLERQSSDARFILKYN
jgi:hypothetical protein